MELADTAAEPEAPLTGLSLPADDDERLPQGQNEISHYEATAVMDNMKSLVEPYCRSYDLISEHAKNKPNSHTPSVQFNESLLEQAQPNELWVGMGELVVGCILWLKHQGEYNVSCSSDLCCGMNYLRHSGYNHPVVVLRIFEPYYEENLEVPVELMCSVACMTTFADTPLELYLARRHRDHVYRQSMPLSNGGDDTEFFENPGYPGYGAFSQRLCLEQGYMRKQSYVRLNHVWEVPVSMLQPYSQQTVKLEELSYDILVEALDYFATGMFEAQDPSLESDVVESIKFSRGPNPERASLN